ncbi:MAG: NAD-dependent epimerase/dehydratase family protein [Gemmataceae bacterium]
MILLLTGATGFVGRNLLLGVLAEGRYEHVIVPVRSRAKLAAQLAADGVPDLPPSVIPVETAAPDWRFDFSALGAPDHVVHGAGLLFGRDRAEYFRTNVDGTLNLLRQLPDEAKTVILSSLAAAGPSLRPDHDRGEADPERPLTWYGESKLEMERGLAAEFAAKRYLCLRPPMVLGPRDQATLPLFKMARNPVRFKPGLRTKTYSWIGVNDLTAAVFAALAGDWTGLPHRSLFVAAERPITDWELIAHCAAAVRRRGLTLRLPQPLLKGVAQVIDRVPAWRRALPSLTVDRAREIWPDRWVVSAAAFGGHFGWRPAEELPAVLQATCDWYVRAGQLRG